MRSTHGRVLVTGGLGFIGSNLARRLAAFGARVTVVDSCQQGCGANPHNLAGAHGIEVVHADIGDTDQFRDAIETADVVFNLAGEISHLDSMLRPERDLSINTISQLRFLLACCRWRPNLRVVYASTRQVYGVPQYLPVDERHPVHPVDYNGVHKYAAGQYHLMLTRKGDLDAVVLRLTNVYGPRMSLVAPQQGFLSAFLRKLLLDEPLAVYGDGSQLRDPLFIDDCVDAFIRAAELVDPADRVFNIGGPEHLEVGEIADIASRLAGLRRPERRPFPQELRAIDIGSYFTDSSLFANTTGWRPRTRFADGFRRTLEFFQCQREHYLTLA